MRNVPKPLVLVVEDDRLICEMVAILLRARGCAVEQAHDGLAALQIVERHLPPASPLSLILLDVRLPLLDGQYLLGYLRKRDISVPVIAMSGHREALATAAALGAQATVEKPFDLDQLLALVHRSLAGQAS